MDGDEPDVATSRPRMHRESRDYMKRAIGSLLMAAGLFTTGCAASAGYNRGYYRQGYGYGGGYRYDRAWDRHNPRDRDRRDDRYRHDGRDRDYDRDHYQRY